MKNDPSSEQRTVEGTHVARGRASNAINNEPTTSSLTRLLVTTDAIKSLDEAVSKVTKDFDGGRIGRKEVASWLLRHFAVRLSDTDIEKIRAAYFDRVAYLESLLRRAKETGICPQEIDALFDGRSPTAAT